MLLRHLDPDHGPEQIDARLVVVLLLKLLAQCSLSALFDDPFLREIDVGCTVRAFSEYGDMVCNDFRIPPIYGKVVPLRAFAI